MTGGTGDYYMDYDQPDALRKAKEFANRAVAKWESTTNKVEVLGYTAAIAVAIWVTGGLIDAVDHLPLLPFLLKLVGTTYSGWFTYRFLLFAEGREDLRRNLKDLRASLTASATDTYMRAAEGAKPPAGTGVKRGDAPRLGEVDSASNLEGAVEALKEQQQRPLRAQGPASAWPPQKGAAGGAPGKGAKGFGKNE